MRICAKNAGGAYARGGANARGGAYLRDTTVYEQAVRSFRSLITIVPQFSFPVFLKVAQAVVVLYETIPQYCIIHFRNYSIMCISDRD